MLITITTTHRPATDLGYLLAKHPDKIQQFDLPHGRATVFYPEAAAKRCTAALMLEIDPVKLTRGRQGAPMQQDYVNDRPYAASSYLAAAVNRVYRSACAGQSRERPALADTPIPLEIRLPAVRCDQGGNFLRRLFQPLGYQIEIEQPPLDPAFPQWGASPYAALALRRRATLQETLRQLCVLLPALDGQKHYWVNDDEIDKLLRHGAGWLDAHPEKETIASRYLKKRRDLVRQAMERMPSPDQEPAEPEAPAARETRLEKPLNLAEARIQSVIRALKDLGANSVADLGCGEGRLLTALAQEPAITRITGLETALQPLATARRRLARRPETQQAKITLLHGSLSYRDDRLAGHAAAVLMEVIEHIDPARLDAVAAAVFGAAAPAAVIITTPNREYNRRFNLPDGELRHHDHRFEWTRPQFRQWAEKTAATYNYAPEFAPIGDPDPELGPPTQMAVFRQQQ